ncbi:hypothetical protein OG439_11425 [Amycolatopsis sp. NBC_01307]|uniref:hypothetical protein n=1 Tax=Amycolatopsis sp. NBC_01307 TaxID=2903561 RepID=UPI002E0F8868|nr:hypothetical protein OG439_11425 [Amycolatopsis sp. NBC_01307]
MTAADLPGATPADHWYFLSGVEWAIVFEGVNDIGTAATGAAAQTADDLIDAYDQIITRGTSASTAQR